MLTLLKKLGSILNQREKKRFVLLLLAFLLGSLFEVVGIASIMPFMQLVAQPDAIEQNKWLHIVYQEGGFESERMFMIAIGIAVLVLMGLSNVVLVLMMWLQEKFVASSTHEMAVRLLSTYIHQPYEFFLSNNSSNLTKQILSEVRNLATTVLMPLVQFCARIFLAVIIFALLLVVDPTLALIVMTVLGIGYALIYLGIRRYLAKLGEDRFIANQDRFKTANEALGSIKILKVQGGEAFFIRRFGRASALLASVGPKFQVAMTTPVYLVQTLAFGGLLTIVIYLLAVEQDLQNVIPILSLYALAGYRLMPALQQIFKTLSVLPYGEPTIDSIYVDLQMGGDPALAGAPEPMTHATFSQEIRVEHLSFCYAGTDEPVLRNISLAVPKGARIAFVGPTGSGKTTLVDIILGLLRPSAGAVLIDGKRLKPANTRQWQRWVGYVPQEVALYDDTIWRNIVFGLDDAQIDFAKVQHVARIANIHDFIVSELPDGYDTVVGERGVRLSGGQRQRIGLARALYREPQVLVLDEATSALDGITEDAVLQAIDQVGRDITILMIAHRLATVKDCDHIYLLDDGEIVEEGTYEALLETSSMFRDMAKVDA